MREFAHWVLAGLHWLFIAKTWKLTLTCRRNFLMYGPYVWLGLPNVFVFSLCQMYLSVLSPNSVLLGFPLPDHAHGNWVHWGAPKNSQASVNSSACRALSVLRVPLRRDTAMAGLPEARALVFSISMSKKAFAGVLLHAEEREAS